MLTKQYIEIIREDIDRIRDLTKIWNERDLTLNNDQLAKVLLTSMLGHAESLAHFADSNLPNAEDLDE